jgi:hypothetical protein
MHEPGAKKGTPNAYTRANVLNASGLRDYMHIMGAKMAAQVDPRCKVKLEFSPTAKERLRYNLVATAKPFTSQELLNATRSR